MTPRVYGMLLTGAGVLALSPDSVLIRLLDADVPTTLFWRGLAMAGGLFAFLLWRDRRRPAALASALMHRNGWGLGLLFALSNILFVSAIKFASVSDTLGALATASIFAAVFSVLFLGERAPPRTWIAAGVIALGLMMIAFGGAGSLFGRALGIATAAVFGATFVFMRAIGEGDTLPGLALGGLFIVLATALPAQLTDLSTQSYAATAGLAVILPVAFGLIGRGPRYLPAPEVSLLMLLETVFGTLWAWLVLAEAPTGTTLAAIAVILATLAVFYWREGRVNRQAAAELP
ncbi:hypothetical protein SAOR_07975 [Salinisphaera orenii MK-B5]|uniref:EamA domain-containing protein n=1 Tax=Salinisphaera orenii MK-B5 TaxID=856730 RepID=A0A423PQ74_9GAMM|nr:DMT family transporter [Salinisphaera orenii]ROO27755.1 hypothetical protein SAOR_07975 [Salinisphaera orenii MK-B5]